MIVGVGASPGPRPVRRRPRRWPRRSSSSTKSTRSAGPAGRRLDRRPRRARADPQPDPHRDGRLHRHARASSSWRPPTAPRSSTRRCCGRGGSTAGSWSTRRTWPAGAAILEVHTRSVPLADDVDLDAVAGVHAGHGRRGPEEPGQRGGAARRPPRSRRRSTAADFSDALEKILLGTARGIMLSAEEKERTAFHESGHALLGMLTPGRRPGPQGHDHPARPGARRHLPEPDSRPVRLLRRVPARPDHRGDRRPGRRGDHLRRRDHRCRERPGAGDQHRPPDGRPVGHVRADRAGLGAARTGPGEPLRR